MGLLNKDFSHGRVAGKLFTSESNSEPMLVLFNQWRSGAKALLSYRLATAILSKNKYGSVLFVDRIGSGGVSDNKLSKAEKRLMKTLADKQFASLYAMFVNYVAKETGVSKIVIGGSSGASSAVVALADQHRAIVPKVDHLVLAEPAGLKNFGAGKYRLFKMPHALTTQAVAYRHRLQRGWWTPMDREQYFAKGHPTEFRAQYFAKDLVYQDLLGLIGNSERPYTISVILSENSHLHDAPIRSTLQNLANEKVSILLISGNHDKICQPPSLANLYNGIHDHS